MNVDSSTWQYRCSEFICDDVGVINDTSTNASKDTMVELSSGNFSQDIKSPLQTGELVIFIMSID
jgi:hypothetical protein